ncbi:hypothetical protein [Burkholderia plantarii]|uniref:hypothetical protein n=1 Tax=Burkholderia plantarii TaxID=41899 RepID=UPI000F4FD104|nr:hypothetical protein [Burkholderia plantarii]WLE63165.1 hypothetical protein GIY62_22815 [Burkholderia plantarii]
MSIRDAIVGNRRDCCARNLIAARARVARARHAIHRIDRARLRAAASAPSYVHPPRARGAVHRVETPIQTAV